MAGPLLGGWFTDGPGWRWIFYINLPVGIAALVITSMALKLPTVRREHTIDYLGAALIVASVSSLLLYLDWAGKEYGWFAPGPLALFVAAVALTILFVIVEQRAAEPIIPLRLFQNAVFRVGNLYGFLAGIAMFGAIIFLPFYLQAVMGMSPTESGLAMLPAVFGISHHVDRLWPADHPHRALQDLPHSRRGDSDRRVADDVPAPGRYAVLAARAL